MQTAHYQLDRYGFNRSVQPVIDNRHQCQCIECRRRRHNAAARRAQVKRDIGAGMVFAAWFVFTVWLVLAF